MSYHPSHASAHHTTFLNAGMPAINYAHNHSANATSAANTSLLGGNISSHSFPMAPSPNNGTPQPQQQQQQQQPQQQQQQPSQQQQQQHAQAQQQQQQQAAVAAVQQHQQPTATAPPGVPDQEGLIAPPSMPLELDFDNLESASNYMHTYALSQGFDIRIQWSANNQTRICWSCYRGGFPESLNADGTPNTKKRQIPKEKERRKRGSLKIGCPFRVQCTKNWKTGKMELRILEGRHKHQMETDRENLPSQVRRIKNQRKAQDSPGTPQGGNAAANAVAQAANLTATPTPASSATASASQAGKARASNAANPTNANASRNGTPSQPQVRRTQQQQQQPQQQQQAQQQMQQQQQPAMTPSNHTNLLVNTGGPSAHQHLSLLGGASNPALGTPTPSNGAATLELDSDLVLSASASNGAGAASPGPKPSFERQMLNLLGVYDRSDGASRSIMDKELESMLVRAEARLDKSARKKRKIGPNGSAMDPISPNASLLGGGTPAVSAAGNGGSIAALARGLNGRATPTQVNGVCSPLRSAPGAVGMPQTPLGQVGAQNAPPSSGKGSARCSNCKEYGHNRRRCPLG